MSSYRDKAQLNVPLRGPSLWGAALALIVALFVQMEILHYLTFRNAQISIVLVVVVWYALRSDLLPAVTFGLLAGLCEDVFSAQTGAAWSVSTTLTAVLVNALSRWFFADSILAVAAMVWVATLTRRMAFWIVMALQGYPAGYARLHLHEALWESLMNAGFIAIAMLVVRYVENRRLR